MAQRRMFSKQITDTDAFLDMPATAQNLYFHLNMHADDDGFLGNAKTIRRMVGASEDDLKILVAKQFILIFPDGVSVIRDWHIHNYIQKDRYHPTIYQDDKKKLEVSKNKQYQIVTEAPKELDTTCIHDVYETDTQSSLVKSRSGKSSQGKVRSSSSVDKTDNSDNHVDNFDDDDDKKNKLLLEINRMAKKYANSEPTATEWNAIKTLAKKLSWKELRLVVIAFSAKVANKELRKPYPYLLTVLNEKVMIKKNEQ